MQVKDDPDKAFLLAGIKNGFRIANKGWGKMRQRQRIKNPLPCIPVGHWWKKLKTQIEQGHVIASEKPAIISPLGSTPKDDWSVRLIHDGSLLEGVAMKVYSEHNLVRCHTIQDTCLLAKPGDCTKLQL